MLINKNGYHMIDEKINNLLEKDLINTQQNITKKTQKVLSAFDDWMKQNYNLLRALYEGTISFDEFGKRLKPLSKSPYKK